MYFVYVKNLMDPSKPWPQIHSTLPANGGGPKEWGDDILQVNKLKVGEYILPIFRLVELYPYKKEGSNVEPISEEAPAQSVPHSPGEFDGDGNLFVDGHGDVHPKGSDTGSNASPEAPKEV